MGDADPQTEGIVSGGWWVASGRGKGKRDLGRLGRLPAVVTAARDYADSASRPGQVHGRAAVPSGRLERRGRCQN